MPCSVPIPVMLVAYQATSVLNVRVGVALPRRRPKFFDPKSRTEHMVCRPLLSITYIFVLFVPPP